MYSRRQKFKSATMLRREKFKNASILRHSKSSNDMYNKESTWKDVYSDEETDEDEYMDCFPTIPIQKAVSFETTVNVILIPETKEYGILRDMLWYNEEELQEFVAREIEIRKKERENQQKELQNMRIEEIYTIMNMPF